MSEKYNSYIYNITQDCYKLVEKIQLIIKENNYALYNETDSEKFFNDENFKMSQIYLNNMKKNFNHVVHAFGEIKKDLGVLKEQIRVIAQNDSTFPKVSGRTARLFNDVAHYENICNQQLEEIEQVQDIHKLVNTDICFEVVNGYLEHVCSEADLILENMNEYSVQCGNKNLYQAKEEEKDFESFAHVYTLSFYDYFCEKNFFGRLKEKETMKKIIENARKFYTENVDVDQEKLNKVISLVKKEDKNLLSEVSSDYESFKHLLYLSTMGGCQINNKTTKFSRDQLVLMAQSLKQANKSYRMERQDDLLKMKQELFTDKPLNINNILDRIQ